jgi:two-component system nitrogen regulation response regulator GlnG
MGELWETAAKRGNCFWKTMKHIFIVDDEEAVCWSLQRALGREGHSVSAVASAEQAFSLLEQQRPDVVVLDVRLPGMDGLTALARFRQLVPEAPVIIVTAFGDLPTAVRAVEGGAFDYLAKPFDLQQAIECIHRALLRRPAPEAVLPSNDNAGPEEIVGRSVAMQNVFKRIALVAPRDACVLITGESGTGKELVARAIHRYSARRDRPFLPVHVAALNPNLVESELFGHTRGAFTGATQARPGLLALADGGTVFLDELADIPLPVQIKLLRVLEHNEVLPVGGTQPQPLDIRILAATHQDLTRCVAEGRFRHDLFFRLNVFPIALPPLRERPEDIEPLAEHFLRRFAPRALPLPPQTVRFLQALPWFGNVRELRNALEHATIVARGGTLLPEHFPNFIINLSHTSPTEQLAAMVRKWLAERVQMSSPTPPSDLYAELLRCIEPALLDEVMKRVQGNRWAAAQWLGLNRATVRKKLTLYNLHQAPTPENAAGGESESLGDKHDCDGQFR